MKKRVVFFSAAILIVSMGLLYVNSGNFVSGQNAMKKCCVGQTTSTVEKDIKAGGDQMSSYEFVTDKVCCEQTKSSMQKQIMSMAGVRDVQFSSTCSMSKMTKVTVIYSPAETNNDKISASIKEKNLDCSNNPDCNCPGYKKNESSGKSSDPCPGNCDKCKNKKTSGKNI